MSPASSLTMCLIPGWSRQSPLKNNECMLALANLKKGFVRILHFYRLDALKIPGSGRGEIGRPPR